MACSNSRTLPCHLQLLRKRIVSWAIWGTGRPNTHKLLELLFFYANPRSDTNPLAHELIDRFGSLAGVLDAPPEELCKVKGMGKHGAVLLKTVKELSGRYLTARTRVDDIARNSRDYYQLLRPYFFGARNELLCLLCMDGKHKVLGIRRLGEGNVNAVAITTRLITEAALALNAAAVVLAHNHVSGIAFPSEDDIATTRSLAPFLAKLGVELVDHLIFVDDDMVSLRDSGFYQP